MVEEAGDRFNRLEKEKREGWRQRLGEEYDQMKQRAASLHGFIQSGDYHGVSDHQKGLLTQQLGHMQQYVNILKQRIDNLDQA